MRARVLLVVAVCLGVASAASAQVQISLRDGRVSLNATNASITEVLEEWTRVGHVTWVNIERAPKERITVQLIDVPESEVLETLFHSKSYIAVGRSEPNPAWSTFERVVFAAPAPAVSAPSASATSAPAVVTGDVDAAPEPAAATPPTDNGVSPPADVLRAPLSDGNGAAPAVPRSTPASSPDAPPPSSPRPLPRFDPEVAPSLPGPTGPPPPTPTPSASHSASKIDLSKPGQTVTVPATPPALPRESALPPTAPPSPSPAADPKSAPSNSAKAPGMPSQPQASQR